MTDESSAVIQWGWMLTTFGMKCSSLCERWMSVSDLWADRNICIINIDYKIIREGLFSHGVCGILSEHKGVWSHIKVIITSFRICSTKQSNSVFTYRVNLTCKTDFHINAPCVESPAMPKCMQISLQSRICIVQVDLCILGLVPLVLLCPWCCPTTFPPFNEWTDQAALFFSLHKRWSRKIA